MECLRLLLEHLAWIEHQFLSGIRDSRKAGSLWGMMRGVGGVRKSEHQSWLVKGLGYGLLCWGFKGVQQEIPWEEASTLQVGSAAFPPGQCTSPLWPIVVVRDRVLSMGQVELNCVLKLNWIVWIRTVWLSWIAWNRNVFHNWTVCIHLNCVLMLN